MQGGRSNTTWHGRSAHAPDIVVKLYNRKTRSALFPNSAADEYACLTHPALASIAPKAIAYREGPAGDVMVYTYVPGTIWASNAARVGGVLRDLHRIPPPKLRHAPNGSAEIAEQTHNICAALSSKNRAALIALRPQNPVAPSRTTVFLHGDLVPGNIIQTDKAIRLIDWQCPAIGDPCDDLAMFLSPAMQLLYRGKPLCNFEKNAFVMGYGCAETKTRLRLLMPWYHWRMAAYCLYQSERGHDGYLRGYTLEIQALSRHV